MKPVYAITLIAGITLGSLMLYAALASAAANPANPAPTDVKGGEAPMKAQMSACPMCPMMAGKGMDMGKEKDMPIMKQRCQMMMNAEMSKDDATCLLASKQELKLTPEQVQKLEQIVKQSRQEAAAILTPDQQKTLAAIAEEPLSMCTMHARMHDKMMQKTEATGPTKTEDNAKKEPEGAAPPKK